MLAAFAGMREGEIFELRRSDMNTSTGAIAVTRKIEKDRNPEAVNRHKTTGESFPEAIATMTALNRDAAGAALTAGALAATDVTGFGLLGHLHKMCRASGVGAVIDRAAVPVVDGALDALRDGFVSGGTRRNLEWVRPHVNPADAITDDDLLLLADAQTSGGLLVVGEIPGHPVIGHTIAGGGLKVH